MELVDIGANLTHNSFRQDLEAVLDRAEKAGVRTMLVTGTSVAASEGAIRLAAVHPEALRATVGIHPHDAKTFTDETTATLRALAGRPGVVALGECGLDFNRNYSPREDQERCFEAQLALATDLELPLFLHERDAHERFVEMLRPYRDRVVDAVLHCFTGTRDEARACLDLGLHLGVTGWICDDRRGQGLRELVSFIPADRMMIETDAPYLTPRTMNPPPPHRRNEPAFLVHVLASVAEARGESVKDTAAATTATARRFFRL